MGEIGVEGNELPDWAIILYTCLGIPALVCLWFFFWMKPKIDFKVKQREFQKKAFRLYSEQRFERRRMIVDLLRERADWEQIAYILNSTDFRDVNGHRFNGDTVKAEHSQLLSEKYVR